MDKKTAVILVTIFAVPLIILISYMTYKNIKYCSFKGCDEVKKEGSTYCELHALSVEFYGTPDYEKYWADHPIKKVPRTPSKTPAPASDGSSGYYGSYSRNNYSSYDDGYDDVYFDDDYDWDRYYSDSDYADGVDDAMEDWWD